MKKQDHRRHQHLQIIVQRRYHIHTIFPKTACLVVRAHLVGELHALQRNFSAKFRVVEHQSAVDVNIGQRVHEAEHPLRRPGRSCQAVKKQKKTKNKKTALNKQVGVLCWQACCN